MKKVDSWNRYFQKQMSDPELRGLVEEELKALRVGVRIAKLRQQMGVSQTELAARTGMSAPNISRIENSPSQNMTLGTLVKLAKALGCDVEISLRSRRTPDTRRLKAVKA